MSNDLEMIATDDAWTPAFPGQRPPFELGNVASLTHGVWSPRKVDPLAEHLIWQLHQTPGLDYLAEARFAAEVLAWAKAEARVALLEAHVDKLGIVKASAAKPGTRAPIEHLAKWEGMAAAARGRLGLTPKSWVEIRRSLAGTAQAQAQAEHLLTLAEAGKAARESRTNDVIEVGPSDDTEAGE
jgi:hypothetical protein